MNNEIIEEVVKTLLNNNVDGISLEFILRELGYDDEIFRQLFLKKEQKEIDNLQKIKNNFNQTLPIMFMNWTLTDDCEFDVLEEDKWVHENDPDIKLTTFELYDFYKNKTWF